MTEEMLRERFLASLPETDGSSCPPPDDLWAVAAGELPFHRVQALLGHATRCAQCAEALGILQEVRRASAELPARTPPELEGRRRAMGRPLVPLALAALAGVGAWVVLRMPAPEHAVVERGLAATPSLHAISPPALPARDPVLRWSEYPGASSYNVTVLTPDLVVVHHAVGLSAHELRLPDAVAGRARGAELLWTVDAVLPDGHAVASPTFQVRLQ